MHGCRQFVAWAVPFSGVTNATLVVCYICQARLPPHGGGRWGWRQISMSLDTWGCTRDTMGGTEGRNTVTWSKSQKPPPVRIEVCNRPHEAGIASNRGSAIPRWIRSQVLYSPPVNSRKLEVPDILSCIGLRQIQWQGVSRNKARVAEAARGTYPIGIELIEISLKSIRLCTGCWRLFMRFISYLVFNIQYTSVGNDCCP
jgi:hypothetical protein